MLECSRRGAAHSMYGLSQGCPCCTLEAAGAGSVFDLDQQLQPISQSGWGCFASTVVAMVRCKCLVLL